MLPVVERLSALHRLWRMLPAGARRAWLQAVAGFLAKRADPAPPMQSKGVVLGGELTASTGLGEAARIFEAALGPAGFLRGTCPMRPGGWIDASGLPKDAALLLTVNAPSLPLMLARAPRDFLRGRRIVASMAWELPVVPAAWGVCRDYVHEIWACSDFTATALEAVLPGRVRVVPYPLAMLTDVTIAGQRAAFGLPEEAVVVTVIFGLGSSFTRKNPLGAIAAFKLAFGTDQTRILLVKLTGQAAFPAEAAQVAAAASGQANIRILSGDWPATRMADLLGVTDILLSLHRAEGFGLVPAQAMLRGIAVVATGWSGNLQFMDAESAALVGFDLVAVDDPSQVYGKIPGAVWAAPDVGQAAAHLLALADDPVKRTALGLAGQARAQAALDGRELLRALAANGITA